VALVLADSRKNHRWEENGIATANCLEQNSAKISQSFARPGATARGAIHRCNSDFAIEPLERFFGKNPARGAGRTGRLGFFVASFDKTS